jgi:hypothetical protein
VVVVRGTFEAVGNGVEVVKQCSVVETEVVVGEGTVEAIEDVVEAVGDIVDVVIDVVKLSEMKSKKS